MLDTNSFLFLISNFFVIVNVLSYSYIRYNLPTMPTLYKRLLSRPAHTHTVSGGGHSDDHRWQQQGADLTRRICHGGDHAVRGHNQHLYVHSSDPAEC